MIKTYILEDLDCAHCAGKIEEAVGKLDGVKKSTCTLLTQKLVVDVEDDKAASLTAEVKKIVKKYEPDVQESPIQESRERNQFPPRHASFIFRLLLRPVHIFLQFFSLLR